MSCGMEARAIALHEDLGDRATADLIRHLQDLIDVGYAAGSEPFGDDPAYQDRMRPIREAVS